MIQRYESVPSPQSHVVLYTLGGAVGRQAEDATAVAYRDSRHILLMVGMWTNSAEDETNTRWVRELWGAVQPFASAGFYVNYEADTPADRISAAYGARKFERLVALKAKYDPTNLFRLNQNIPPALLTPGDSKT